MRMPIMTLLRVVSTWATQSQFASTVQLHRGNGVDQFFHGLRQPNHACNVLPAGHPTFSLQTTRCSLSPCFTARSQHTSVQLVPMHAQNMPASPSGSTPSTAWGSPVISPPIYTTAASSSTSIGDFSDDDVAIIGMACRTAGGNNTPEKLWEFLLSKGNASGEIPSWRWEPWIRRDPRNAKVIEKTISKGYFINDLENFDAAFFGVSPKEAEMMDPHQRLGLEVTWEALENAGINPRSLAGSDTAVYMAVDSDDYSRLLLEDLPNIEAWMGLGTTAHGIPNRISYHLDLMGPSAAVDAACASSLVAVHIGRQAILSGDSRVAIVGGVHVCLSPALFQVLGSAGALSSDGECLSFDDNAHGYARGEGAAILVLKRLSHAVRDGDRILATLKGSAVAHDGKTNGIMAPNAKAQELVARKALSVAGIDPLTVGYIEAHATSTSLGDPTELSAISAVYGTGRPQNAPVAVGSIKPNIGHMEAAAGTIGLIKSVLAVQKGQLAPQTNLNKLNSRINWEKSGLHVVRESTKWSDHLNPRRAAICSYGYGGTVSHTVIEQSPVGFYSGPEEDLGPTLLVLSAPQEKRLAIQSAAQAAWIASAGKGEGLRSIATTLSQHRAQHDFRAVFVVSNHEEASKALDAFTNGSAADWTTQGRVFENGVNPGAVWIFSGHGAQWADMGKELLQQPVFLQSLELLDCIVAQELGYSAIEKLRKGNFSSTSEVQVLTYLTQVGLGQFLKSKGAQPEAVIGHSVGEIAASVTAGCLTPEEGTLIVARRARLYSKIEGRGAMYLVSMSFDAVLAELGDRKDIVAAINSSPSSCVVSGAVAPLAEYVANLKERGIRTFKVQTDIAFHSPLLEDLSQPLRNALSHAIKPKNPSTVLYSTSQADARSQSPRDTEYWIHNMVESVNLMSAVHAAVEDGYRIFLEVSTHPIVMHSINEILLEKDLTEFAVIPTMKRNLPAQKSIVHAIGQLYVKGSPVDFRALTGNRWSDQVPGFQWSHKPFWKEVSTGLTGAGSVHDADKHTLLGQSTVIAGSDTTLFTTKLDESSKPFPFPHQLHGVDILPVGVYANTFYHSTKARVLADMTMQIPLAITDDPRDVQIVVEKDVVKVASRLSSSDDKAWVTHSSARWADEPLPQDTPSFDIATIKDRIGTRLPNTFSLDHLIKVGVSGIAYPWVVTEHYGNAEEMIAKVDNFPDQESFPWDESSWAPTIDAATSIGSTIFSLSNDSVLRIVSKIKKVFIYTAKPPPKVYYLYVKEIGVSAGDARSRNADVFIVDVEGQLLAELQSLTMTELDSSTSGSSGSIDDLVHQMAWVPAPLSEKLLTFKHVVLISSENEVLERFSKDLQRHVPMVHRLNSAKELAQPELSVILQEKEVAIVYCAGSASDCNDTAGLAHTFIWEVATAVKHIVGNTMSTKFFIVTDRVFAAESTTAIAQGPLIGLARVVAGEHSDIWGGLIDNDGPAFPITPMKYARGQEVIRFVDGVAWMARLRPFTSSQRFPRPSTKTLLPRPEGVYVVTGGLGSLGLETCDFLIEKGARRIVVVSRRSLPPRAQWASASPELAPTLERIQAMEKLGASIHAVALDIGAADAHIRLKEALDRLSLPPVLGIIHASGVLEDSLLIDTSSESFERVLSPKISGAMTLHKLFPPGSLDFFVLYSSIGQVVGTSGQSSYASGNSFLDTLAAYRRNQGDNTIAFQWTAWRGLGMATATDFLAIELESKGITDISREEGFRAWEHMSNYDTDHAVVTRTLTYDEGEPVPCAMVTEIAKRRPRAVAGSAHPATTEESSSSNCSTRPSTAAELKPWLDMKIRECIASVLKIDDIDEIDSRSALQDLGLDSVMTVPLRQKLQAFSNIKVPQTLTWNYPTTAAMVEWFVKQFEEEAL